MFVLYVAAAASPRDVPTEYPRRGRGVAATRLHWHIQVAPAASPRLVSAEYPPRGRGAAATRLHWHSYVAAAASPRLVYSAGISATETMSARVAYLLVEAPIEPRL